MNISLIERSLIAAAKMPPPAARQVLMLICQGGMTTAQDVEQPLSEGQKHYAKREKIINRMLSAANRTLDYVRHETLRNCEKHFRETAAIASAEETQPEETPEPSGLSARITFDRNRFAEELMAALREEAETALGVAGQQLFDEIGLDDVFKVPDKAAVKFLDSRENLLSKASDEIHRDVMTTIQDGLEHGDTKKELMARIHEAFDGIKDSRASAIANTETAAAFNFARDKAMRKAGITHKKWLHSQSPDIKEPRPTHVEADGLIVPVDEPFDVSGVKFMYPSDDSLGAGPEDIINCHCVAIPVEAPIESGDEPGHPFRGNQWTKVGSELGTVYHGGKQMIDQPSLEHTQQRDYGFYGKGFYVTSAEHYARTYGGRISKYSVHPDAKVLVSSLTPKDAPKGLVDEVVNWTRANGIARATERGKLAQFEDELASIRTDNLEWKKAVDRYGEAHGFDIIAHSPGEIVVKNPTMLKKK